MAKPKSEMFVSKSLQEQPRSGTTPKLYIAGRSTLDGRLATTLRIRPSLIKELESVAVGPLYLLLDVAIQRLVAELKAMPPGSEVIAIDAETMDPSVYDRSLLEEADRVPKRRSEYTKKKIGSKGSSTDEPGVSDT